MLCDTLVELFGRADEQGEPSRLNKRDVLSFDATGIRILLVEDNEVNQQVATELLESAGAIVRIANHGGEAVKTSTIEGDGLRHSRCSVHGSADAGDGWIHGYKASFAPRHCFKKTYRSSL